MVAKITYGASIYGVVSYNHNKVDEGTAEIIHTHNMVSSAGDGPPGFSQILRSFEDYLSANRRTRTPVAHFSLNPAIEDHLTEDKLKMLADEYMDGMGYRNQPYIVYRHNDTDREHIHIVSVRVDETGAKISDSHDYLTSMAICRELELKYNLKPIPDESKEESVLYLKKINYERGNIKPQMGYILKTVTKGYKFQSFGEFNALLSCFNIQSKIVKGEEQGNLYHGIIYSATNDKGDLVGKPVKSSSISNAFGYGSLNKLMNKESKKITPEEINSSKINSTVLTAIRSSRGKEAFIRHLKKENIDVVFRQNESGRIYGVTFIDHRNRLVLNGSRLGKEFSANAFERLFSGTGQEQQKDIRSGTKEIINSGQEDNTRVLVTPSGLDELFGVFYTPPPVGQDGEPFKKKKKKRRKRNL
jgi:hypothetical protein